MSSILHGVFLRFRDGDATMLRFSTRDRAMRAIDYCRQIMQSKDGEAPAQIGSNEAVVSEAGVAIDCLPTLVFRAVELRRVVYFSPEALSIADARAEARDAADDAEDVPE